MTGKKRLLALLILANLLASQRAAPDDGALVRRQRAGAQRAALARGARTYTFETTWNPPLLKGDSR